MIVFPFVPGQLRATLREIALQSEDPAALAAFYATALGYRFEVERGGFLGIAPGRRLQILPGQSKTCAYAIFAVYERRDLVALAERLGNAGADFHPVDLSGLEPGAICVRDPDGNSFVFGLAVGDVAAETDSRPATARLQHIVFASRDIQRMIDFLVDVVGFVVSDRVFDEHGGLRTAFVRCSPEHHSVAVFAAAEDRIDHHCYEAGDWGLIRDWGDHFAAHHIPVKWGPGRHGPGNNLFLFIHDIDGNWVEISAELEIVEQAKPAGSWPHEQRTLNSWGSAPLRS